MDEKDKGTGIKQYTFKLNPAVVESINRFSP